MESTVARAVSVVDVASHTTMSRLAVLVLIVVAAVAARQAHGNYHYRLDVRTGSQFGADTDSIINFELFNKDNAVISHSIDGYGAGTAFERDTTTAVPLDDWCMRPCRLNVTNNGKGTFSSWRCESVRVVVSGGFELDETFEVGKWIGPGEDESLTAIVDKCGYHT